MAKVKIGKWEIEEEALEQQHFAAQRRGEAQLQTEPQAQQVTYDRAKEQLVIELKNGVMILLPRHLLQGLQDATAEQIAALQVGPRGASLHWESLGVSFSLAGLMAGIFGTQAWLQELGRRGGHSTSTAKAAAARLNGKKGGRPAKTITQEQQH